MKSSTSKTECLATGREFCGKETHPYELTLTLNDIEHRTTRVRRPQTNGFVVRFIRIVLMNSSGRLSAPNSKDLLRIYKQIWTYG
jgi:transposase InsO family protein